MYVNSIIPSKNVSNSPIANNTEYNHREYYCESFNSPENVIVIIIGILSVLINALLLYVMYKDPLKVFRTKISYLVVCLGTADLLTAFNGVLYGFLQPMKTYHTALWYIFWITVMVSVLTVFGMCIERCFAILYPFKSRSVYTKKITLYFCFGVWILGAGFATFLHFVPKIMPFVTTCLIEILLFIIVVLYLIIIYHYKRQVTSAVEKVHTSRRRRNAEIDKESGEQNPTRYKRRSETELLIVVLILVLILFVTFIPYNLALQIHYGYVLFKNQSHLEIILFARHFFPVKMLNFLLNPFVYAWRLDQYKKSFTLVFCSWNRIRKLGISAKTEKRKDSQNNSSTIKELYHVRINTD